MMKRLALLFAIFTVHAVAQAKLDTIYGSDLALPAGFMIEIKAYDEPTRTFTAFTVQFPGEGDHLVTPESLAKAINGFDVKKAYKSPKSLIGVQFKTDGELKRLTPKEKKARTQKPKSGIRSKRDSV